MPIATPSSGGDTIAVIPPERSTIATEHPIFLVGAERSGSTLLRLMLDSHPEVTCCEGFEFMVEQVGDDGTLPPMDQYLDYLSVHRIFGSSQLTIDDSLGYVELLNDFFAQRLTLSGKSLIGAMCHENYTRLLHIWPEARFIHLIRDPRDVARSVIEMGWFGNVDRATRKWVHAEVQFDQLKTLVPEDRRIDVQFADLIGNHRGELARICAFLDIEYTDEMMSYADETAYGLPDPSRVEGWAVDMPDRDVRIVEGKVGSLLTERGFEPSGLGPLTLRGLPLIAHKFDDRKRQLRRRFEKYGARLATDIWLSRLLPIPRYKRSVRLRMNDVERSRRKQSWRSNGLEISVPDQMERPSVGGRSDCG